MFNKKKFILILSFIILAFLSSNCNEYVEYVDEEIDYITIKDSLVYTYGGGDNGYDGEPVSEIWFTKVYEDPDLDPATNKRLYRLSSVINNNKITFRPKLTGDTKIMFKTTKENHYGLLGPPKTITYRTRYVVITE